MSTPKYNEIIYETCGRVVTITMNRPDVYNAFGPVMINELIDALMRAGWDDEVAVIVLTGAGDKAFCTGGDQSQHAGLYKGNGAVGMPVHGLHSIIRDVPKPVIARVRGYSIGGGNVVAALCDLTIASDNAIFGQVGPKVGSVDPGFGTAYMTRVVGEKKARELWYMCRRYTAQEALAMGLVNVVVPDAELDAEVERWCAELVERSPTAMAIAKRAFNCDTENISGSSALGMEAVRLYYLTEESRGGVAAFREKRKPDFWRHRAGAAGPSSHPAGEPDR